MPNLDLLGKHICVSTTRASLACLLSCALVLRAGAEPPAPRPTGADGKSPWLQDLIIHPEPEYPHAARAAHHQGRGLLRLTLDKTTGHVTNVRLLKTTGFRELDDAAEEAFRQWRLRPGRWEQINVPVTFMMDGK